LIGDRRANQAEILSAGMTTTLIAPAGAKKPGERITATGPAPLPEGIGTKMFTEGVNVNIWIDLATTIFRAYDTLSL